MAGSLSAEQTDAFWNDGFLFPVAVISSADALAAGQHFLELMDEPAVTLPRPTNDYAMLVRGADRHNTLVKIAPPATDFGPAELALHTELEAAQLGALAAGAAEAYGYDRGT